MRLYLLFLLDSVFGWQAFLSPEQVKKAGILPWIGVLKVRQGDKEFATGLTLIAERLAAANSNDISKLDKGTISISTKAIFFKHNVPWYCDVTDYVIHPEFDNIKVMNTLAILFLDCDRKNWTSINWPIKRKSWKNVFAVGLNDRNYDFEQIVFRMKFVNSSDCLNFYVKEEINMKSLWPKHVLCSKGVNIRKQCVFDSGMALVSVNNGTWTLIGISVLGPGCVLPSRFIDILPYLSWMYEQTNKHQNETLNYRRQMKLWNTITIKEPLGSDGTFIDDDFYIKKLDDWNMVLRKEYGNVTESVRGRCKNDYTEEIMYRDAGIVRTSQRPATGIYALSLYDLHYYKISCVMVTVVCDRRTPTKFWFERGFKTDDIGDLIKTVPHHVRGQTVPPKILFLTDAYFYYENISTSNLVFKFEFTGEATINVDFYGLPVTTTPTTPTTTPVPPRKHRTHRYHLYRTRGWLPDINHWRRSDEGEVFPRRKPKYRTKIPF